MIRSNPVINGQTLFDAPFVLQETLVPTEGGGYEVASNEADLHQRSRILEAALIEGFKANALQNFQNIQGDIGNHLSNLSETDRYRLYGELNAIGFLPYLGAGVVGRGYAQEVVGFLVPHEKLTYFQYGLYEDLETAFQITDVASLGALAASKPARDLGSVALRRMASGGRRFAGGVRNIRFPKLKINWLPGGVIADTMGNPYIVWPKFNLSFSMGGGRGLAFSADDLVYGPSAGGMLRELQQTAGGKLLSDIGSPYDFGFANWTDFSLATLDDALRQGNKIHFDLTYMKNLEGVLKGTAFQGMLTTKELLYLRSNWTRFRGSVFFYRNGEVVSPPWFQ